MVLLTILTLIALVTIVIATLAAIAGGVFGIVIFGDLIVCVLGIVWLMKFLVKRRKKRRGR